MLPSSSHEGLCSVATPSITESHSLTTDLTFPSSTPRRSSSYHSAVRKKKSYNSLRSFRSGTPMQNPLPETILLPSRTSSLQRNRSPITPEKTPTNTPDSCPFPLTPSPLCSPTAAATDDPAKRPLSRANPYLSPPASPDRFVPARKSRDSLAKSYRLSKPPSQLTPSERIMRHRSASRDPFRRRRLPRAQATPRAYLPPVNTRPIRQGSFNILPSPRAASAGAVWNVGGVLPPSTPGPMAGVPDGRGGVLGSGTNAPMFTSDFLSPDSAKQSSERFEGRLAAALEIDQTTRVLDFRQSRRPHVDSGVRILPSRLQALPSLASRDSGWFPELNSRSGVQFPLKTLGEPSHRLLSDKSSALSSMASNLTPTTVLDAPLLRDDFYCSILAYCYSSKTLAVGLRNRVYLWSEASGVTYPPRSDTDRRTTYVSSLSFSSTEGANSILAVGRSSGKVTLWSLHDEDDRCEMHLENAIACVAFKPVVTKRTFSHTGGQVDTEELLIGDEVGTIYYYSIEWTKPNSPALGADCLTLLAKIDIHTQQICGIAWATDGQHFATGGNDNVCLLFSVRDIMAPVMPPPAPRQRASSTQLITPMAGMIPDFIPNAPSHITLGSILHTSPADTNSTRNVPRFLHYEQPPSRRFPLHIRAGREMHRWTHSAAVKAIAFCPWQRGLVATGGGSNDRAIHFFHAWSGACLATINVQAQVTSLIWSNTRREIAATFGYAQPEHQYRIAVFSWPDCRQVMAIPWSGDLRALYAVAYPGGPNERGVTRSGEGERWWRRTAEEGCIVVASSDESVKFHEVWSGGRRATTFGVGGLGWSDILEGLEGVDKEGDVIR